MAAVVNNEKKLSDNEKIELLRDYKKLILHAVKSKREITEKS